MELRFTRRGVLALLPVMFVLLAPGCSKKPQPAVTPPAEQTETSGGQTETTPRQPETPPTQTPVILTDIFFDYDRANIRADQRAELEKNARMLSENPDQAVLLEGHCDERGTVEYNLALGQRRAEAVRGYLVEYGVDGGRVSTISYGEERPFAQGHDESAWALNRRVHFAPK